MVESVGRGCVVEVWIAKLAEAPESLCTLQHQGHSTPQGRAGGPDPKTLVGGYSGARQSVYQGMGAGMHLGGCGT